MKCLALVKVTTPQYVPPAEEVRISEYFARTKPEDNDTTGNNEPTAFTPTGATDTIQKENLHVSERGL